MLPVYVSPELSHELGLVAAVRAGDGPIDVPVDAEDVGLEGALPLRLKSAMGAEIEDGVGAVLLVEVSLHVTQEAGGELAAPTFVRPKPLQEVGAPT